MGANVSARDESPAPFFMQNFPPIPFENKKMRAGDLSRSTARIVINE